MRTHRLYGVVHKLLFLIAAITLFAVPASTAETILRKSTPFTSAIACMKNLPDGAPVCINNKSIIGIINDTIYVEEPDRSSGIKINVSSDYIPYDITVGGFISCTGVMATFNNERFITSAENVSFRSLTGIPIGSLAMSSEAIMGWPKNPKKPLEERVTGLLPMHMLVSIWGKVTGKSLIDGEGFWYLYLDDGWGKLDGSNIGPTGIRIYSNQVPADSEPFQKAVGVLDMKQVDPTPTGPDGDDIFIPVIRTTAVEDVYAPQTQPVVQQKASVSGTVRLVGQSAPGVSVRIYSTASSTIIHNVTNSGKAFTLEEIPVNGGVVAASASGYLSETINLTGGTTDVIIELHPCQTYLELKSDEPSIAVCSEESTLISVLCRDYEGKGISNKQIQLTTTRGTFTESQAKQLVGTTDDSGFVECHLISGSDGEGTALITASSYPEEDLSATVQVPFIGPQIALSASQYNLSQPGTSTIQATLLCNGHTVPGALLTFKTGAGLFQPSNQPTMIAVTDDFGKAQATLSLRSPGTALVTVGYTNHCSQRTVNWLVVSCPTTPWYSQSVNYSNPLVTDLDGSADGKKEIVLINQAGTLLVFNAAGTMQWSKSLHPSGDNTVSCAVLDSERSGRPCIFVPAESQAKICVYAYDGRPVAGWPVITDYIVRKASIAVGDINLDGTPEVVAGDECCYVFSWNPTGDWKGNGTSDNSYLWRNLTGTTNTAIYGSSCAIGDLNGDPLGILDVAIGTNQAPETYAFPGDAWGDFVYHPLYLDGWPRHTGGRVESSPALGDIDGDGRNDYVVGCDAKAVFMWLSSDKSWRSFATDSMVRSSPALCDLDDDGKLDVVIGSNSGKVYAFNWLGQAIDGWSGGIHLNITGNYAVQSSPVVGDVTGDGEVDVVIGCNDGNVYALYKDGRNHEKNGELTGPIAWVGSCTPGTTTAQIMTAPVIDDIDNDGKVEILAAGDKGVYMFHLDSPYSQNPALYPWPTFHHDNQRTGCATPPPAPVNASIQGIVTKNGQTITQARIYIYENDGSPVYQPHSNPPQQRSWVYSVGNADTSQACRGAYCISQLEPNKVYKIKVEAPNEPVKWINNIAVTTGLTRVDIEL